MYEQMKQKMKHKTRRNYNENTKDIKDKLQYTNNAWVKCVNILKNQIKILMVFYY